MDEVDIKLAAKVSLRISKTKEFILSNEEKETLIKASKILGECC